MSNYYTPEGRDGNWMIYIKSLYLSKTEDETLEDILEKPEGIPVRVKAQDLERIYKDDDKISRDMKRGLYPAFKVDGTIEALCLGEIYTSDKYKS